MQVFYHRDKQQTLDDFARVSNERWLASAKAKIAALPAVARANGKPGFRRFSYENPTKAQQAYEMGAFGIDGDQDGNEFVLDVVMTGNSKRRSIAPRRITSASSRRIERRVPQGVLAQR